MKSILFLFLFPGIALSQLTGTLSSDQSACLNASSPVLTFTGGNGTAPYTFTYTINGGSTQQISGTVGSTAELMVPTTTAGTYNYQLVEVEDAMGNTALVSDNAVFTIHNLPFVNAGPDQTVCVGTSVHLTASGAVTYSWDNGVVNGVAFVPSTTTTYTVTGTDVNGCVNTDQVVVMVNPLPNVNAGPDQTVCAGQSVTLSGSGAATYVWNNGVTNGVAFVPSSTTTYTVTGTSVHGCINTDQVTVFVDCVNINEESMNEVMIYPVPAVDELTIESHLSLQEVFLYNEVGQQVYNVHVNGVNCKLDLKDLNSGVYYLQVLANERTYHTRIVKL